MYFTDNLGSVKKIKVTVFGQKNQNSSYLKMRFEIISLDPLQDFLKVYSRIPTWMHEYLLVPETISGIIQKFHEEFH